MPSLLIATALTFPLAADLEHDSDWTAWRGARADGVAAGSPPVEFGEEANLKWKAELPGRGLSTPVIVGERVFVTSAVSAPSAGSDAADPEPPGPPGRGGPPPEPVTETDFLVLAFDRADGSVLWDHVARTQVPHQGTHRDGSFAAPSIASDGEHLFVSFGSYGIYAYDLDGELAWEVDLGDMDIRNAFGEGSSPVLHDDALFLLWDHEGASFLVALDKKTGAELWRTERAHGTNWCTPLVAQGKGGKAQVIVASSTTVAYDAATGEPLWTCGATLEPTEDESRPEGRSDRGVRPEGPPGREGGDGRSGRGPGGGSRRGGIIATPLLHDGVLVYGTGTRRGGSIFALRVDEADGDEVEETGALLWTRDRDAPRIPSPIAHDGILYALKSTSGILAAFDLASGEPVYEVDAPGGRRGRLGLAGHRGRPHLRRRARRDGRGPRHRPRVRVPRGQPPGGPLRRFARRRGRRALPARPLLAVLHRGHRVATGLPRYPRTCQRPRARPAKKNRNGWRVARRGRTDLQDLSWRCWHGGAGE